MSNFLKKILAVFALSVGALYGAVTPQNGVIVSASSDQEAVNAASVWLVEQLNILLADGEGANSGVTLVKVFGRLRASLPKSESANGASAYLNNLRAMLKKEQTPKLLPPTGGPVRISASSDEEPRYYALLPVQEGRYRSALIFFAIEKITKLPEGKYDVAIILGRFFVSDPVMPESFGR